MTREARRETLEAERNADEGGHGGLYSTPARLSDADLLRRVVVLAAAEREATVELVAHLAELDARRLYLGQGYGSLFGYCTGALCLAEHAAFNRIQAARASREFPAILDLLADGSLNLSTVRLIAPHLRTDTFEAVVTMARGRSKREVELLVAGLAPRPDVVSSVRRLAVPVHHAATAAAAVPSTREQPAVERPTVQQPAAEQPAVGRAVQASVMPASSLPETGAFSPLGLTAGLATPPEQADSRANGSSRCTESSWSPFSVPDAAGRPTQRPVVAPLAPGRYRVQFTVGEETHEKLRRAQDLLRREIPDGDPGAMFDRALTLLLEDVARKKLAQTSKPRPRVAAVTASRDVPASVKRAVWIRDGGRCAFVAPNGRRCTERAFLELHHQEPYAIGGEATVANISLRCHPHNTYEAELVFGPSVLPVAHEGARGGPTRPGASHARQIEAPHAPSPKMWSPVRSVRRPASVPRCRSRAPEAPVLDACPARPLRRAEPAAMDACKL